MAPKAGRKAFRPTVSTLATAYADQTVEGEGNEDDELVIPEDLSTLSDEDLEALANRAVESFDAVYGDGTGSF
ncbi:MAG: hypothetical protein K0S65_3228, partial [Labilithrix sp.]|nr:hypothetical protein [Labilithrix sp.]